MKRNRIKNFSYGKYVDWIPWNRTNRKKCMLLVKWMFLHKFIECRFPIWRPSARRNVNMDNKFTEYGKINKEKYFLINEQLIRE